MNRLRHLMSLCIFISLNGMRTKWRLGCKWTDAIIWRKSRVALSILFLIGLVKKWHLKKYELWRTMSSRYEINYSFLKKGYFRKKEKRNLWLHQQHLWKNRKKGRLNKYEGFLNIADEDGTTLSDSQYFGRIATRSPEGGAEYKTNGCTLYTHSLGTLY